MIGLVPEPTPRDRTFHVHNAVVSLEVTCGSQQLSDWVGALFAAKVAGPSPDIEAMRFQVREVDGDFDLLMDDAVVIRTGEFDRLIAAFVSSLRQERRGKDKAVSLPFCVVEKNGEAVALVGHSEMDLTSVCLSLSRSGWSLVSEAPCSLKANGTAARDGLPVRVNRHQQGDFPEFKPSHTTRDSKPWFVSLDSAAPSVSGIAVSMVCMLRRRPGPAEVSTFDFPALLTQLLGLVHVTPGRLDQAVECLIEFLAGARLFEVWAASEGEVAEALESLLRQLPDFPVSHPVVASEGGVVMVNYGAESPLSIDTVRGVVSSAGGEQSAFRWSQLIDPSIPQSVLETERVGALGPYVVGAQRVMLGCWNVGDLPPLDALLGALPTSSLGDDDVVREIDIREISHNAHGEGARQYYLDGEHQASPADTDVMSLRIIGLLNRLAREQHPKDVLSLHAGAVGLGSGSVVIAGPSGAGKSTLVAALTLAGHPYLTDEVVNIDGEGVAAPYPKPLSIRAESHSILRRRAAAVGRALTDDDEVRLIPPSRLGAIASAGLRVDSLVTIRFEPGAPTELEALSTAETAQKLIENAFPADGGIRTEADIVTNSVALARRIRGFALRYSDLDDVVDLEHLLRAGQSSQPTSSEPQPLEVVPTPSTQLYEFPDSILLWKPELASTACLTWSSAGAGPQQVSVLQELGMLQ